MLCCRPARSIQPACPAAANRSDRKLPHEVTGSGWIVGWCYGARFEQPSAGTLPTSSTTPTKTQNAYLVMVLLAHLCSRTAATPSQTKQSYPARTLAPDPLDQSVLGHALVWGSIQGRA
jgi:hypothetical protein